MVVGIYFAVIDYAMYYYSFEKIDQVPKLTNA